MVAFLSIPSVPPLLFYLSIILPVILVIYTPCSILWVLLSVPFDKYPDNFCAPNGRGFFCRTSISIISSPSFFRDPYQFRPSFSLLLPVAPSINLGCSVLICVFHSMNCLCLSGFLVSTSRYDVPPPLYENSCPNPVPKFSC